MGFGFGDGDLVRLVPVAFAVFGLGAASRARGVMGFFFVAGLRVVRGLG